MQDPFVFLPNESIFNIALFLPLNTLIALCLTSSKFNQLICDNNYFWIPAELGP